MAQTALRSFQEVLSRNGLLPRLGVLPVIMARFGLVIVGTSVPLHHNIVNVERLPAVTTFSQGKKLTSSSQKPIIDTCCDMLEEYLCCNLPAGRMMLAREHSPGKDSEPRETGEETR